MKLTKGMMLKVKTTTKDDIFGECLYEILETGLPAPEPTRKGIKDGVKCLMLGGSGKSARHGLTVPDSEYRINIDIEAGKITIVSAVEKDKALAFFKSKQGQEKHSGTGVVEL